MYLGTPLAYSRLAELVNYRDQNEIPPLDSFT
jgi:hypothetical protein